MTAAAPDPAFSRAIAAAAGTVLRVRRRREVVTQPHCAQFAKDSSSCLAQAVAATNIDCLRACTASRDSCSSTGPRGHRLGASAGAGLLVPVAVTVALL